MSQVSELKKPLEVFYSYAHEDESLRKELEKQLSLLQHQGFVSSWNDRDINAGTEWEQEINQHLEEAQIILLLISPDFMSSDYCYGKEMKRALERLETQKTVVIPIILRPTDWHTAPFGKLQAFPKDGLPVTSWSNQDEAFLDIARGIRQIVQGSENKNSWQKLQFQNIDDKLENNQKTLPTNVVTTFIKGSGWRNRIGEVSFELLLPHTIKLSSKMRLTTNEIHLFVDNQEIYWDYITHFKFILPHTIHRFQIEEVECRFAIKFSVIDTFCVVEVGEREVLSLKVSSTPM